MAHSADGSAGERPTLGRREFCIGVGGAVALAGFVLVRELPHPGASAYANPHCPRLKPEVTLGREGDLLTLTIPDRTPRVLCAVNEAGAEIVRRLDGRHSVEAMAAALAHRAGVECAEALCAKTAAFIAELASAGLLTAPFYAILYEEAEEA